MHKLGLAFLVKYYKILLSEKYSLVVLAENDGTAYGFHSGTSRAEEHRQAILKNKCRLAITLVPPILKCPRLTKETIRRFRSLGALDSSYRVTEGPRGEYWAWLPSHKDPASSIKVLEIWHKIMKASGVPGVRFEVDLCNKRIAENIGVLKAEILKEVVLPDGRKRQILELKYGENPAEDFTFLQSKGQRR